MFSVRVKTRRANFGPTGHKMIINLEEFQANPGDPEKATTFKLVNPQEFLLKYPLKNSINKKKLHYKSVLSGRSNECGGAAILLLVFSIFVSAF